MVDFPFEPVDEEVETETRQIGSKSRIAEDFGIDRQQIVFSIGMQPIAGEEDKSQIGATCTIREIGYRLDETRLIQIFGECHLKAELFKFTGNMTGAVCRYGKSGKLLIVTIADHQRNAPAIGRVSNIDHGEDGHQGQANDSKPVFHAWALHNRPCREIVIDCWPIVHQATSNSGVMPFRNDRRQRSIRIVPFARRLVSPR